MTLACRLFGHCRQAFYQSKADINQEVDRERKLVNAAREIREEDPRIGGYKLWLMLVHMFGHDYVPGRDRFFAIMRRKGLMLPKPKPRHTTNSNHRYHKWKNLTKGFTPVRSNQLWVADITYIAMSKGEVCYLHLITDAYSRKIVGWVLSDSLKADASMRALQMAIDQAASMCGSDDLSGLIHHSDRGVQYCCDAYVNMLKEHGITISMTEDYKPTDNAIAERFNGILKTERVYPQKQLLTFEQTHATVSRFIQFYNTQRPHMSIGYKTPSEAHLESGEQKKMWKKKIYTSKKAYNENNSVSLHSRTEQPDSACPTKLNCQ